MIDQNIYKLISLTKDSIIKMTVHDDTDIYQFADDPDDFELYVVGKSTSVYGLSCSSVKEVIGALIQDYATGIIKNIEYVTDKQPVPISILELRELLTCINERCIIYDIVTNDIYKFETGIDDSFDDSQVQKIEFRRINNQIWPYIHIR